MKAELKLTHDQVVAACMDYVRFHDWKTEGTGQINIVRDTYDQRDNTVTQCDRVEFVVAVVGPRE